MHPGRGAVGLAREAFAVATSGGQVRSHAESLFDAHVGRVQALVRDLSAPFVRDDLVENLKR